MQEQNGKIMENSAQKCRYLARVGEKRVKMRGTVKIGSFAILNFTFTKGIYYGPYYFWNLASTASRNSIEGANVCTSEEHGCSAERR